MKNDPPVEEFPVFCARCGSQMTDYELCPDCGELYPWNVCAPCKDATHQEALT